MAWWCQNGQCEWKQHCGCFLAQLGACSGPLQDHLPLSSGLLQPSPCSLVQPLVSASPNLCISIQTPCHSQKECSLLFVPEPLPFWIPHDAPPSPPLALHHLADSCPSPIPQPKQRFLREASLLCPLTTPCHSSLTTLITHISWGPQMTGSRPAGWALLMCLALVGRTGIGQVHAVP